MKFRPRRRERRKPEEIAYFCRLSDQQKLPLAEVQMAAKFVTNLTSSLGGQSSERFSGSRKSVGKAILAAHEDSHGNQPENFLVARLAIGKISGKAIRFPARTLDQYSCLPDKIVSDLFSCHKIPKILWRQ